MNNKTFLFGGLIWACAFGLFAQETGSKLTLNQLLDSAVQRNYLLQAYDKNNSIKLAEIEMLKTNYLPKINASASFSFWKFLLPNKEKLLGNTLTDMYTDITAYQTLYDWGENNAKKSLVNAEMKVNDEVRRQIRNTIIWGVADTYFENLNADTEIQVHKNALEQLKEHLKYAENLYSIGKVSGVDVLKVKVQIALEEKNLQITINSTQGLWIKLRRLSFLNENAEMNIENKSEALYNKQRETLFSAMSLYENALQNHPVLLAGKNKIAIESKQKEIYNLASRPELYSYGIGSWEHGYIPFGNNFNYNIGVGIRYTIPYWGGSSFKSKVKQSDYRIEQLKDENHQSFLELKKEIDMALNVIDDIKSEISNNQKIINLSNETLKNALVKYQAGQGPILDVLDAQSILTNTTIAYNKSTINYLQALVKLHYLTGNDTYPF